MIITTPAATTAIYSASRTFKTELYVDGSQLDCNISTVTFNRGACGRAPSAGAIFVPYIEAELRGLGTDLVGKTITATISVKTSDGYVPINAGTYVVSSVTDASGAQKVTAIGTLGTVGSERATVSADVPQTVADIIADVSTATGITIRTVGVDTTTQIWESLSGTWRSVLSSVAKAVGGFLTEDVDGNWTIASYCSGDVASIAVDRSQTAPQYGKERITLSGYTCETGEVDMSMGNPLIDPWDVLAVTDLQGVVHLVPCLQITHTVTGGLSTLVTATAETEVQTESTIKGPIEQMVQDATNMAESVVERADSGEFTSTILRVDSSRGTAFKNADVNTVLSAVIFYGSQRISTTEQLHETFGSGAYLQWQWQGYNSATWHIIPSSDSRLGDGGFTLTLSPSDVDIKAVFSCSLMA